MIEGLFMEEKPEKKISNANGHAIITITRTTGKKPKAY